MAHRNQLSRRGPWWQDSVANAGWMRLVQYVKYQTESTVTLRGKSSRGYQATATGDTEIQSTRILIQTARNRREQNLQPDGGTYSATRYRTIQGNRYA